MNRFNLVVGIGILALALQASAAEESSEERGFIRLDRLEEVTPPQVTAGEPKMSNASLLLIDGKPVDPTTLETIAPPETCDCKVGGRKSLLSPFVELVKATRRRSSRQLTCGTFKGVASWYTARRGKSTASGRGFDPDKDWAAHKTLPFGTVVKMTCPNGETIDVTIVDNGPFIKGRDIDVTPSTADKCGFRSRGHTEVTIEVQCPTAKAEPSSAPKTDTSPAPQDAPTDPV